MQRNPQALILKRGKPYGAFYGNDRGDWIYEPSYLLGQKAWEWWVEFLGDKLYAEGATEYHRGFRKALAEIVRAYPEILDLTISFDGPGIRVRDVLAWTPPARLQDVVFLHGTSEAAWQRISAEGLRPRSLTGAAPAYGHSSGAKDGDAAAVYLTTQRNMAAFAARDAAANMKSKPVILEVFGIDPRYAIGDHDSGLESAQESLERLGSIAYQGVIPARQVQLAYTLESEGWRPVTMRKNPEDTRTPRAVVKLAEQITKTPKDAEIDVEALQGLCDRLGWECEGPYYAIVQDKGHSVSKSDTVLLLDASHKENRRLIGQPDAVVIEEAIKQDRFLSGRDYESKMYPGGVQIVEVLPEKGQEGARYATDFHVKYVDEWVESYWKEDGLLNRNLFEITWKSYYSAKAYKLTNPETAETFEVRQNVKKEWKQPAFWKWAVSGDFGTAVKAMMDDMDSFEKKWLLKRKATDNPDVGTCACCFGTFVLDRRFEPPRMVLHGYERPGFGYILGRCSGIDFSPYELSAEGTKFMLSQIEPIYLRLKKQLEEFEAGRYQGKKLPAYWLEREAYRRKEVEVHYGRCPPDKEKQCVKSGLISPGEEDYESVYDGLRWSLESAVRMYAPQVAFLKKMIAEWKLRPLPIDLLRAMKGGK